MGDYRDPFEYVSWCDGPSVDISPLVDFPLCTNISYQQPTFALHRVPMTIPDLAPPPLCPCIWSFDTQSPGHANVMFTDIARTGAVASALVYPEKGEDQNCCDPSFQMELDLELPCIPFDYTNTATVGGGGIFDFAIVQSGCELKFSFHVSFPTGAGSFTCIPFDPTVTHTAEWSGIGDLDIALRTEPGTCVLIISYDFSIPCVAFGVTSDLNINIGSINGGLAATTADCNLKLSADISLPEADQTVIVSVRLDTTNGFQVYKKVLKGYEVVDDLGWSDVISVGSCTNV